MSGQSNHPDVSILITSWNGCDLLRNCLHSVYEKTAGLTYEIIVVDDGSTDGTAEMIRREFPEVKLIVLEQNVGFAKANNRGVKVATGRYVLLLNTDTLLLNNAVKTLVDFLETHPETGACGGWLLNSDMSSQVSFGTFPSFHQAIVDALFLNDLFPWAHLPNRGVCPDSSITEPIEVDYVTGADILIRKDLIDQIGLFDERFQAYCEETDFCYRLKHEANKKVHFVPQARLIHLGGMSYNKFPEYQACLQYSSYHKFLTKHHGAAYSFLTRFLYAWHYFVKMIVRFLRYLLSSQETKEDRKRQWLTAWYIVHYSLAPNEKKT